jgi:hypothetical protein
VIEITPPPCFVGGGGMPRDVTALPDYIIMQYIMNLRASPTRERVIGGVYSEDDPRPFPGVDDLTRAPPAALSGWTLAASGTPGHSWHECQRSRERSRGEREAVSAAKWDLLRLFLSHGTLETRLTVLRDWM